jgi:glucosamine-6-phosphate deaminase
MKLRVFDDEIAAGRGAAATAAGLMRDAIAERGRVRILVSAGSSLAGAFAGLIEERGVAWREVEMFHVAEFLGVGAEHPGSLRKFLFDHFIRPTRAGRYHLLDGKHDPERVCRAEGEALRARAIDVALIDIGENGQLALNEPPADFATERPYLIVRLEHAYRQAQVGDGRFTSLADVPDRAISVSIRQLLKAEAIVCTAAGLRKAEAVRRCVEGPISPLAPASVLRTHPNVTVCLDCGAAALLRDRR